MVDFGVSGWVAVWRGSLLDLAEDERTCEFWAVAKLMLAARVTNKHMILYFIMRNLPFGQAASASSNN